MSIYDHPAWAAHERRVLLELDPDLNTDDDDEKEDDEQ